MADEFQTKLGRLYRKAQLEWLLIVQGWTRAVDAEETCGDWDAVIKYLTDVAKANERLFDAIREGIELACRGVQGEDNIADDENDNEAETHRLADAEED